MVFLHAIEQGVTPPRVSTDLDVLVNARVVNGGVREFVTAIEGRDFVLVGHHRRASVTDTSAAGQVPVKVRRHAQRRCAVSRI